MRGIGELACEVFDLPVYKPEQPDVSGVHAYFKDPQYATAPHMFDPICPNPDEERPPGGGEFKPLFKGLWPFGD